MRHTNMFDNTKYGGKFYNGTGNEEIMVLVITENNKLDVDDHDDNNCIPNKKGQVLLFTFLSNNHLKYFSLIGINWKKTNFSLKFLLKISPQTISTIIAEFRNPLQESGRFFSPT